jgi:hypothetical protein
MQIQNASHKNKEALTARLTVHSFNSKTPQLLIYSLDYLSGRRSSREDPTKDALCLGRLGKWLRGLHQVETQTYTGKIMRNPKGLELQRPNFSIGFPDSLQLLWSLEPSDALTNRSLAVPRAIHVQKTARTLVQKAKGDVLMVRLDFIFPLVDTGVLGQLGKRMLDFTSGTSRVDKTTLTQNKGNSRIVGNQAWDSLTMAYMAALRMIHNRSAANRTRVELSTSKPFRETGKPVHEAAGADHMATGKNLGFMGDSATWFRDPMYGTTCGSLRRHLLCADGAGQIDRAKLLRIILDCLFEGWPVDVSDRLNVTADCVDDGSRIHSWIYGGHDEGCVTLELMR